MGRALLQMLVVAALSAASACSHASAPVSSSPHGVHRISGRRAQVLVDRGAVLVDVRSELEFLVRHIDGARNIPLAELRDRVDELGARDAPVVLYGWTGSRSAEAARILREAGFSRVFDAGSIFTYGGGTYHPPPPRRARRWGTTE